jgi:hypothetical protein
VRPCPSTITAPVIAGCSAGSIALIVSPSTRTLRPVWSLSDLPSKIRTLVKTTGAPGTLAALGVTLFDEIARAPLLEPEAARTGCSKTFLLRAELRRAKSGL